MAEGEPPQADFDYTQAQGTTVEFYDLSYDGDGEIVSWDWDFGDGSNGSTAERTRSTPTQKPGSTR